MVWHMVQSAETLTSIAEENGLSVEDLLDLGTPLYENGVTQLTNRTLMVRARRGQFQNPDAATYLENYFEDDMSAQELEEVDLCVNLYPGERIWVPDPSELQAEGVSEGDGEDAMGDSCRGAQHCVRSGATLDRGSIRTEDGVVQIRVIEPPWGPNDLSQWHRWQLSLSTQDTSRRVSRSEEYLWCAAAQGRRISLFWRHIRERTWSMGTDNVISFVVAQKIMNCCLDRPELDTQEAIGVSRQERSVPADFTDGAVRFHAWRWLMKTGVYASDAQAGSGSVSTTGIATRGIELQRPALTLDPREPYYSPVPRIRQLLSLDAVVPASYVPPIEAQAQAIEILAGVLFRGSRWQGRLRPGWGPPLQWLENRRADICNTSRGYQDLQRMTIREFYRVVYYMRPRWVLERMSDDFPDRVRAMLTIMDHCRTRYQMNYLRMSHELISG